MTRPAPGFRFAPASRQASGGLPRLAVGLVILLAAAAQGAPWNPSAATPFPEATRVALEAVVRDARAGGPDEGLSVVVLKGEAAWLQAFGFASVSPRTPATTTTSYRIGSVTKTFTAVAALRLAAEGRLSLDEDVRALVPAFPAKPWPVTPRQLLGHTSGVGWYRGPRDAWTTTPTTTAQALDLFRWRPLVAPPGAQFLYSSFGYVLLGAAIERAAGESYAAHLQRTLWGPLGLAHTGLEASPNTQAERAAGYRLEKGRLVPARPIDLSSRFSSGGLRSTAEDLARWAHALLRGEVVDADTWRAMTTPGVTTGGDVTDYGLGFAVYPVRGRKVLAHSGGVPGATALLLLVPEEDFAVVLLSNLQGQTGLMELAVDLSEVVLDGGSPRRGWYATSRADEVAFDGFRRVLSHGLMRFSDAAPPPGADVGEAFAALDTLFAPWRLELLPGVARAALKDAYHPRSGRVSAVAGAEMARLLASRGHSPGRSRLGGPAAFFVDYARACEGVPCRHLLGPEVVALAERLDAQWRATPPALRTLRREALDGAPGLDDALSALEDLPGHVDLVDDLTHLAWRQRAAGRLDASRATLEASVRLHPTSALAVLAQAESAALDGDALTARLRLGEAAMLGQAPAREAVKSRADVLAVGAPPLAIAALDALVAQAKVVLPPADTTQRPPGLMRAAPDGAAPAGASPAAEGAQPATPAPSPPRRAAVGGAPLQAPRGVPPAGE
ncbi:MAG: serine hydrolase [Myxococcota bacterium]